MNKDKSETEKYKREQKKVWDMLWKDKDTTFDTDIRTQWFFFDKVKFERLEKIFPEPEGCKTLEAGCGSAIISTFMARRGYKTVMLDFSSEALRVARNNFEKEHLNGLFAIGDVETIPFKDNYFDIVMSHGLLEHFEDIRPVVSEMVRVLKPGGMFFADLAPKRFSVDTIGRIISFFLKFGFHLAKLDFDKAKKDYKIFRPGYYENSLSAREYKKIMEEEGLINVKIIGDRPFPALSLTPKMETIYIKILKRMMPLWKAFDGSRIAIFWGAGWWAYGIKRQDENLIRA